MGIIAKFGLLEKLSTIELTTISSMWTWMIFVVRPLLPALLSAAFLFVYKCS